MNDDELSFDRVIKYTITNNTSANIQCPTGVKGVWLFVGSDINIDPAEVTLTTFGYGTNESVTFSVSPITNYDPNYSLNTTTVVTGIGNLEDDSFPIAALGGSYYKFYPMPITGYSVTYNDIPVTNTIIYLLL